MSAGRRIAPTGAAMLGGIVLLAPLLRTPPAFAADPAAAGKDTAPADVTTAGDVISSEDIVRALATKPKTRGLTLRARSDARETPAAAAAVDLDIPFELDSAALRADATSQLGQLERALKTSTLERARFRITGHTDASGSAEHNRALSLRRARAVQGFLTAHGIDPARLDIAGAGADQLLKPDAPRDAANRRVEIRTIGLAPEPAP